MKSVLLVGCGGFVGAVLRYWVAGAASQLGKVLPMPIGTLTVNVIGCALMGVFAGIAQRSDGLSEATRLGLGVGLLGGFTTYSAFGMEAVNLLRERAFGMALAHIGLHLFLGLGAVVVGYLLTVCVSSSAAGS